MRDQVDFWFSDKQQSFLLVTVIAFGGSVPILELKGSIWYVQTEHPTLVTQVDLIIKDWWEFKVLD